jgi:hypothetical protein
MIGEIISIGDIVAITIPKENREWGYNPCPDGTQAEVVGFGRIAYGRTDNFGHPPGIYENRAWIKLMFKDGRLHTEYAGRLSLLDSEEEVTRVTAWREIAKEQYADKTRGYLEPLPDTAYWELDHVQATSPRYAHFKVDEYVITRIDYLRMDWQRKDGSPWPIYNIQPLNAHWDTSATEDDLALVRRGNVWRFCHDEELSFDDIKDEANFYRLVGRTTEVRNPATDKHDWTKEQALQAIKDGLAHGFSVGTIPIAETPYISVVRFDDESVGRRVAAATLEGFGLM